MQEPVAGKVYETEESDFRMESRLPKTYRYTYVRDHPSDWDGSRFSCSEAGIDEFGASCSATFTTNASGEISPWTRSATSTTPPARPADIGEFSYADVILGENKTAREAVILLRRGPRRARNERYRPGSPSPIRTSPGCSAPSRDISGSPSGCRPTRSR